jgi:DNA-binding PadR family transcriptional regulator
MHGYELIRSIEEKSHGMWRPSPGTIYPLLQLLEETDIVVAREEEGKKIYSLTDIGIEEAKQKPSEDRWKGYDKKDIEKIVELKKNNIKAMHLIRNIARSGDKEKLSAATKIIKDTSDRLMALTDEPTKDLNDKRGKS